MLYHACGSRLFVVRLLLYLFSPDSLALAPVVYYPVVHLPSRSIITFALCHRQAAIILSSHRAALPRAQLWQLWCLLWHAYATYFPTARVFCIVSR